MRRTEIETLYRTHGARWRLVAGRITRDAGSAEDVVQNAFEKALRRQDEFRSESLLSTWMYRIVVTEALFRLRTDRRRAQRFELVGAVLESLPASATGNALATLETRAERLLVRAALERLAPEDRRVLEASLSPDFSTARFAAHEGLGTSAAKTRLFRARRRAAAMVASIECTDFKAMATQEGSAPPGAAG